MSEKNERKIITFRSGKMKIAQKIAGIFTMFFPDPGLVFFSPFSIAITSLGEERANLSAFRTFVRFMLV